MAKKTIADVDVKGKRVLMRVDFNVPIEGGQVTDDKRIVEALPTIKYVLDHGAKSLVLMSHLGRPKGPQDKAKYSMKPAVDRLALLLGKPVKLAPDVVGPAVKKMVDALQPGEVLMLENLRIYEAETKNGMDFAKELASYGDLYVNDAFGTSHRAHASMHAVPQVLGPGKRVAGFLIEKELKFLGEALAKPRRPFVAILGGAKVSDKLGVIESLIKKADDIIVGGAMAYTFFAGRGQNVGGSLVELNRTQEASGLEAEAGGKLHLPVDTVAIQTGEIKAGMPYVVVRGDIADDKQGVDIGPDTREQFARVIARAKTIFWNGPMGVFEKEPFDAGTVAIARAVADATSKGAVSVIGGGDSAAILKAGLETKVSHISTGGGASLEFVEGLELPGVAILDDK